MCFGPYDATLFWTLCIFGSLFGRLFNASVTCYTLSLIIVDDH